MQFTIDGVVSKKAALTIVVAQAAANAGIGVYYIRKMAKEVNAIIEDQNQRLHIFKESVDFLLERADPDTVGELNQNLEYWRVIREMPPGGIEEK